MERAGKCYALAFLVTVTIAEPAPAQWAARMFNSMDHDFGTVARGQHVKTQFKITNIFDTAVHIASAVPSCSICTVTKLEKNWLKPGESMMLEAGMNTIGFTGPRSVSVTVTFDRPSYSSARLTLRCYSRSDVVFSPGEILLGDVKQGTAVTKRMKIHYAGRSDWQIASATCTNPAISVDLKETHRRVSAAGSHHEIGYEMTVSLKTDAPAGRIYEQILLGINDAYNKSLPVLVRGTVKSEVNLSPKILNFGNVSVAKPPLKQVLVLGKRPFKIVDIEAVEPGPFQIERSEAVKRFHTLKVRIDPEGQPGKVTQVFRIKTNLDGMPPLELTVTGTLAQ